MEVERENVADSDFDIGSAMDAVAADMPVTDEETAPEGEQTDLDLNAEKPVETTTSTTPVAREMPKSWAKDKAEMWSKLDPAAQDYYEVREKQFLDGLEQYKTDATMARTFKDIITPYRPMLTAAGVTEADAVKFLLNAQYQMTNGTPEQRRAAYEKIGQDLGLSAIPATTTSTTPIAPELKMLQDQVKSLQSTMTQRQQAELRDAQAKASGEVEKFASDKANAYFDEVAQDMVPYINQGMTLPDAYERAIWANPVTRAKEQARIQTENEAKLKENARLNALKARTTASNNIRGKESLSAPTEPKGKLFDDMGDILKEIKSRAN